MYPPEVVIAEKVHAMVVLDIRNTRMKDFYDLWYLAEPAPLTCCSSADHWRLHLNAGALQCLRRFRLR